MSIGTNIRDARLRLNLTQEELAAKIGVTKNAISNYENGVSAPKFDLLDSLMSALDLDANALFSNLSSTTADDRSHSFFNNLKEARTRAGIPLEAASKYLSAFGYSISTKTLSDYESGIALPSVEVFLILCEYYNITDIQHTFRGRKKRSFEFSAKITTLRKYLGLTKNEFASILNVSMHVVDMYESGQSAPSDDIIKRLTEAFPVPDSFFKPNPPNWEYDYFEDFIASNSDDEKLSIIQKKGLDPRVYDEYFRIVSQRFSFKPAFRVNDSECALITAYRSHPEMQAAVNTLLGISPTAAKTKNA